MNQYLKKKYFQWRQFHTSTYYTREAHTMCIIVDVWFLSLHPGIPINFVLLLFYAGITGLFPESIYILSVTIHLVTLMIPVNVKILAKDSCTKDIRNSRYFDLLDVRGDRSSQVKAYMF